MKDSKSCVIAEKQFPQGARAKKQIPTQLELQNCNKVKYLRLQQQQQQQLLSQQKQVKCRLCGKFHADRDLETCQLNQERSRARSRKIEKLYNFVSGSNKKTSQGSGYQEKELKISILEPRFINFPVRQLEETQNNFMASMGNRMKNNILNLSQKNTSTAGK